MMTRVFALALLLFILAVGASAQTGGPTLFQKPTASRTHIVFVYAGDLWIVPREGGDAKRLTAGVGIETDPHFSPDGSMVAFTGQYDGNTDVYVVPAAGGVPKRLTYHPGPDEAIGWTPDGKQVLFASGRNSTSGYDRLFTLPVEGGGLPAEVPLPVASFGALSGDGSMIAYEPISQWQPDWKHYQGGQTMPIWVARLSDSAVVDKLPRENSNDRYPMWVGDKIYFLSNRTGAVTLFAYDTRSKKVDQLIKNDGLDFKSASAGPGVIALEQFGTIHLYDLKSGKANQVNIRVNSDLLGVRPRFDKVGNRITNVALSPTGVRAVFEARGEILTVPAEKGDPRNLTNTTAVMERDPAWSPDGRWIAYFSDESGEYELHIRDQRGTGDVKKIKLPPTFYYSPTWSPDSKKIALYDHQLTLWYVDLDKGTPVKIDRNPIGMSDGTLQPTWSPDSKWVAYARHLPNLMRAIFIYSLDSGKSTQVTDGLSDARYPAFDRSGKYLYFTASTNLGPNISFADLSGFGHQTTRNVYAVVLRNDLPSPLAPESDEEKVQEEKKDTPKPADATGDKKTEEPKAEQKPEGAPAQAAGGPPAGGPPAKKAPEPVRIDFDGIDQRTIALPIPARNYVDLQIGKGNLIYVVEVPVQAGDSFGPPSVIVNKFDFDKRKFDKAIDGVGSFTVSANGEKALYRQGPNWVIASTATLGQPMPPGAPGGPNMLKVADMEVRVDPQAEWKQMYHEVWRGERDFFYDPNLHGLDLKATEKLYEPYLSAVGHRADLNYLFTEMLNNLTIGHMFIFGGDQPRPNFVPGGLLGADYKIENGRYRFARVYNGENWNPELRAPLTQPGVNVKAGEYLLGVNGRDLTAADDVYQAFEAKANKQVIIKVGPNADGTGAREVTVVPVANESGLRHLAWVEGNRRKVDQLSSGKLAYIYIPNTGGPGYTSFNRYFFAQTNKDGAVIDERFNGGGALADYVVQQLSRQLLSYIHFRYGAQDVPVPAGAIYGPKAMLINEMAGSGGDAMPWYFKKTNIGPLVGKRTWGGLVAAFPAPQLMDGGGVTAPDAAVYGLKGEWEVENHGVAPDIEVEMDPAAWRAGRDPQLEKAVEYLLDELKKNPQQKPKLPPYPNYHNGAASTANK
ncbi:MAG TPA: PDZ domain-containing protein [Blastocatellia bacterium]|nr:PDZ domain-containing protein [Blastocatellia bacterium]